MSEELTEKGGGQTLIYCFFQRIFLTLWHVLRTQQLIKMIKNLIFDFGKVLVGYDFERYLSSFIADPETRQQFFQATCTKAFVDRCDKGESTFEELTAELQSLYPQWHCELQIFHDRQLEVLTGEVPGMRELLTQLKREGYRLYGLTNWSHVVYQVMERYEIFKLLDGQLVSSDVKLIKPDPAIYHCLFQRFQIKPEESVFTDDKLENIAGSEAVGMRAILFENARQYEQALRRILQAAR